MKKYLILFSMFFALIFAACGSSNDPESVAVSYIEKLAAGDESTLDLLAKENRGEKYDEAGKAMLKAIGDEVTKKGGLKSVKVKDTKIEGDNATVVLEVVIGEEKPDESTIRLVKEDGNWKVKEMR